MEKYFVYEKAYDELVDLKSYADEMFNSSLDTLEIIKIKEKVWKKIKEISSKFGANIDLELEIEGFAVFDEAFKMYLRREIDYSKFILLVEPLEKRFCRKIKKVEILLDESYKEIEAFYEAEVSKTKFSKILKMPEIKELAISEFLNN